MTGHFEFDDVIRTAKVIVNPEQSAAELQRLTVENAKLREILQMARNGLLWWKETYPLAVEECDYDALTEIDAVLEETK